MSKLFLNSNNWLELIVSLIAKILAISRKLSETNNYNPEIFCGIKERSFKGFKSNNALRIWDGTYQSSLENTSALIKNNS